MTSPPLIASGNLSRECLAGKVAIVTGAGGGIGFEAARSLIWLGARVVLAELSPSGKDAAQRINDETGTDRAFFVQTDVGSERSINRMAARVFKRYGRVDIVLNNATIAPLGAVSAVPVKAWDDSYKVNLRAPVLLARKFLPGMIERNFGVFVCVASEGLAYMGAYETLKAAQLHLAHTIDAELEGTDVISFTIGPGMVPTATALEGMKKLAALHGQSMEEMMALVAEHTISIEAAGAAFAASIALASHFRGQEIGAKQALQRANIQLVENDSTARGPAPGSAHGPALSPEEMAEAVKLCRDVLNTLQEQSEGWQKRSVFERQWVIRDFKKHAGMPVEQWLELLSKLADALEKWDRKAILRLQAPLPKLAHYYGHLKELSKGYIKDPQKLAESLQYISSWQDEVTKLMNLLSPASECTRDGLYRT